MNPTTHTAPQGAGSAYRFMPLNAMAHQAREPDATYLAPIPRPPSWSEASLSLRLALSGNANLRARAEYQRAFVDRYIPNESSLLPPSLAKTLYRAAFWQEPLPYGTVGVRMMDEFLLDLSWSSSRLEGNAYSRERTAELFATLDQGGSPEDANIDVQMLLNHRNAIDFLVRHASLEGVTRRVTQDVHGLLMEGLLGDPQDLGQLRQRIVAIGGSSYRPPAVPALLSEMLEHIVSKAARTRNPVEAAFFLWVNLAYLQPFVDGNKRTSRLMSNVPLMRRNCAPLSFIDVQSEDYGLAMLGVYERLDLSVAVDLFEWAYTRSMHRYIAMLDPLPVIDPVRLRFRAQLGDIMRAVVVQRQTAQSAIECQDIPCCDRSRFEALVHKEIAALHENHGAIFRIRHEQVTDWIAAGRPH